MLSQIQPSAVRLNRSVLAHRGDFIKTMSAHCDEMENGLRFLWPRPCMQFVSTGVIMDLFIRSPLHPEKSRLNAPIEYSHDRVSLPQSL